MAQEIETVLSVEGMTCGSCVRHVEHALEDLDGVSQVEVRLREGKVRVRHDNSAPTEILVDALKDAGYPSRALK